MCLRFGGKIGGNRRDCVFFLLSPRRAAEIFRSRPVWLGFSRVARALRTKQLVSRVPTKRVVSLHYAQKGAPPMDPPAFTEHTIC